VSLDDLKRVEVLQMLRNLVGADAVPPENSWDEGLRLACQAVVRAPGDIRAVRLEGAPFGVEMAIGSRLLGLMNHAETIAAEYGLRATVGQQDGTMHVRIERRTPRA
jgi:hypothetical protein